MLRFRSHKFADNQGTLMLSTSDPGGGSCRAMVSDVSMVKYTSMGHSCFSGGNKHTKITHETFMENGNAFKSAIVPCYITTSVWTYGHDMLLWLWGNKDSLVHSNGWLWVRAPKRRQSATTSNASIFLFSCLSTRQHSWDDSLFISYFISQNQ